MRCIAVINQKGGVGKTTTTVNLGAALARRGFRVLLIDMDPQANLTVHVDKRPDLEGSTLTNLMVEDRGLDELVQPTNIDNLSVVPSDTSLAGVEQVLADRIGRETILREALDNFRQRDEFDFALLDCPPSLGVLSANALVAAAHVVIPMQAQYLSLQGMAKLIEVIQLVQRRLNPVLDVALLVPCMVDSRTNLSAEVLQEIEQHFGQQLARTRIRNNVKLAEAPSFGRSIFEHAPDSNGARDYEAVAVELLQRLGVEAPPPRQRGAVPLQPAGTQADAENVPAGLRLAADAAVATGGPPDAAEIDDRPMAAIVAEVLAGPAALSDAAADAALPLPDPAHDADGHRPPRAAPPAPDRVLGAEG